MTGTSIFKAFGVIACAAVSALAVSMPAAAQNRDGSVIARFGVFGQGQFTGINSTVSPILPAGVSYDVKDTPNYYGAGLSGGLDWNRGGYILGVEGDFSANGGSANIGPGKFTSAYLATVRGRAGVKLMPDLLAYGTLGLGLMAADVRLDATGAKVQRTLPGFIYGVGLEREWNNVVFFGEYLRSDFGRSAARVDQQGAAGVIASTGFDTAYDANVFRLGVKFKVGHDFSHDVSTSIPPMK
jgi:opacity protein-like surface antigen